MPGWTDNSASIIDQADIYVVPSSDSEPFSFAKMEGQLRGLPTVALANGGEIEGIIHGETGLLARPEAHDLAHQIGRLISDETFRNFIAKSGWEYAGERHTEDRVYNELLEVYEEVI